jgi:hypothetical protein
VESRHRACSTTCYRTLFEDWHSSARGKLVNSVARVSKALLLTLVCSASHSLAQTGAVTDFTGSLVPADKNGPELVGWRSVPTVAQISEVFPKGATNRGYLLWECRVQVDGRLDGCALQAQWPPNDDWRSCYRFSELTSKRFGWPEVKVRRYRSSSQFIGRVRKDLPRMSARHRSACRCFRRRNLRHRGYTSPAELMAALGRKQTFVIQRFNLSPIGARNDESSVLI